MRQLLAIALFWAFSSSFAFAQSPVQHEVGVDLGVGISGALFPENNFGDSQATWSPGWSISNSLKYNALLFNNRLNLGVGLGYQRKSFLLAIDWNDPNSPIASYSGESIQETVILPLEVGYRLPLGGRHSLMADAVFIPGYQLSAIPSTNSEDSYTPIVVPIVNRFTFDMGLKLGYRLQMTEKLSLQASVLGTVQPFEATGITQQEMYTVQLNLGVRHQF